MEITKKTSSIFNEDIYEATHKSGLKIHVMKKCGFLKNYAIFATKYGSIDSHFKAPDDTSQTHVPDGIAHYLEHKMFEEPDRNIFDDFAKQGASANAFTSFDMTAYLFSCTDHFDQNLKTLLHYVQNPYFTDENVEKERGIIGQEIKMYEDHPYWRLMFNFLNGVYKHHPVKLDIAGTAQSISKIDKDILYKCYNTFYHLSNMVLFITGDVDVQKVFELVESNLKDQEYPGGIERIYPTEAESINQSRVEQSLPVSMPMIMMGYKDSDIGYDGMKLSKKQLEMEIILDMMFGKSSSFYEEFYAKGLINDSFTSGYESSEWYANSEIYAETQNPDELYEEIIREVERNSEMGLSLEDFNRIKKMMWGEYVMGLDSPEDFANSFVSWKLKNVDILEFDKVYNEISFEDVKNRFNQHFKTDNVVLSVVK